MTDFQIEVILEFTVRLVVSLLSRKAADRNDILEVVTLVSSTRLIFDVCHYVILDIKEISLTRDHHFDKLRKCVD